MFNVHVLPGSSVCVCVCVCKFTCESMCICSRTVFAYVQMHIVMENDNFLEMLIFSLTCSPFVNGG